MGKIVIGLFALMCVGLLTASAEAQGYGYGYGPSFHRGGVSVYSYRYGGYHPSAFPRSSAYYHYHGSHYRAPYYSCPSTYRSYYSRSPHYGYGRSAPSFYFGIRF